MIIINNKFRCIYEKSCFFLAATKEQAHRLVERLLSAGFSNDDISMLFPDRNKTRIRTNERGEVVYDQLGHWKNM